MPFDDEYYIYLKATDRIISLDEHLLDRNDVEIVDAAAAERIQERITSRRQAEVKANRARAIKEAMAKAKARRPHYEQLAGDSRDVDELEREKAARATYKVATVDPDLHLQDAKPPEPEPEPGDDDEAKIDPGLRELMGTTAMTPPVKAGAGPIRAGRR